MKATILAISTFSALVSAADPSCGFVSDPKAVKLTFSPSYSATYLIAEGEIKVELRYLDAATSVDTWLGFGIGEGASGGMKGSDIVTCQITDAAISKLSCQDRYTPFQPISETNGLMGMWPVEDKQNDWVILGGSMTPKTGFTITLKRALDTKDTQDRVITADAKGFNRFIWAYGEGDVAYHSSNRGSIKQYITPVVFPDEKDPSITTEIFKFNKYAVPARETTYACQSFKLPSDKKRQVIAFQQLDDIAEIVHHKLLYVCRYDLPNQKQVWDAFNGTPDICVGEGSKRNLDCSALLWTGQDYVLPDVAGFPIGSSLTDDNNYVVLEIHYNNMKGAADYVDSTGFKVFYTDKPRANDAAILLLGDTKLRFPYIAKGSIAAKRESTCPKDCTENLAAPITVFDAFLHMHSVGHKAWTSHYDSKGDFLEVTNRVDFWDQKFQDFNTGHQFIINPGDSLYTHCTYNTKRMGADVPFGLDSDKEMCFEFLLYYPRMKWKGFTFAQCGYTQHPANGSPLTFCGDSELPLQGCDSGACTDYGPYVLGQNKESADHPDAPDYGEDPTKFGAALTSPKVNIVDATVSGVCKTVTATGDGDGTLAGEKPFKSSGEGSHGLFTAVPLILTAILMMMMA